MEAKDALGKALKDFHNKSNNEDVTVISDISEEDVIPLAYLFRNYKQMPKIEKKALSLCAGKVLDVGAASGSHTLYLQENNFNVQAIDISEGAVEVMKLRGVNKVDQINFFELKNQKFNTILLLMNGVGIASTLKELPTFLNQCKNLLEKGGQVLLDSSDISYMFEEEDGSQWVDVNKPYYGEVNYQMKYKKYLTDTFKWLFVDFKTLKEKAFEVGFNTEKVLAGNHYDYLARLTLNS